MIRQVADFRFEIAGDHVANLAERVSRHGGICCPVLAKH